MTHYPLLLTPQKVPEIYFNGSSDSTTNTSSFSFTSMDFNVDNPDRMVVVALNYYEFDTSASVSSITIGGTAGTLVIAANRLISGGTGSFIYSHLYRAQPTGASGTVAVTFNRAIDYGCSVGVWSLYNLNSTTPVTSASANSSINLTTQPGDLVVAATTAAYSGTGLTWTNATQNYSSTPNQLTRSGASVVSETNGTLAVSVAITGANTILAGAVWR